MKAKSNLKKIKFNSKKGLTLVELIVAIMILLIAIGASVGGLTLSYHSIMNGAEKDDAQSVAERNCDIIMNCITSNVDRGVALNNVFDAPYASSPEFTVTRLSQIQNDTAISVTGSTYSSDYEQIEQKSVGFAPTGDTTVKKQYFTVETDERKIGTNDYIVYKITTYTYYTDTAYVTCEGEVNVAK